MADRVRTVLGQIVASVLTLSFASGCGSDDGGTPEQGCESLTEYPGDCMRLQAPDPDEGLQLHYGPSSYTPEAMAPYVIQPGEEIVDILYLKSPNDKEIYFKEIATQLRPFGHHLVVGQATRDLSDGLYRADLPPLDFDILLGATANSFGGPPDSQLVAPEDEGLATVLGPHKQIALNGHFLNTSDRPALREAWVNLYYTDPSKVTGISAPLFFIGGIAMDVLPRSRQTIRASAVADHDLRLVMLFGHFHSHTQRLTAYIKRQDSPEKELVYETYDYEAPAYIGYNSLIQTAPPDRAAKVSGGTTGKLELKQGDTVEWECEVVNNDDFSLKWANQIDTAEMCSLFGSYTPAVDGKAWKVFHP